MEDNHRSSKYRPVTNVVDNNPNTSIFTLYVNGLNATIKTQRLSLWIKKKDPIVLSARNPLPVLKSTYI